MGHQSYVLLCSKITSFPPSEGVSEITFGSICSRSLWPIPIKQEGVADYAQQIGFALPKNILWLRPWTSLCWHIKFNLKAMYVRVHYVKLISLQKFFLQPWLFLAHNLNLPPISSTHLLSDFVLTAFCERWRFLAINGPFQVGEKIRGRNST